MIACPDTHTLSDVIESKPSLGPLTGLKVLEVASPIGAYCGKLFADLGADVILIEPLDGSPLRGHQPFVGDLADPEYGIPHIYFNTNKRSVTLDLDSENGQQLFLRLARDANIVIESERPGVMAKRGLCANSLWKVAPSLTVTSITFFGQTGPYSMFEGEDLVALALGGFLFISGYPDLAPSRIYGGQSILTASMYGAVGTMLAVMAAENDGRGQHVDVSIQEAVAMALENTAQFFDLEKRVRRRSGLSQRYTGAGLFPCRDGYVYVFVGGLAAIRFWGAFVEWMTESGTPGADRLRGNRWLERTFRETEEARQIFAEVFAEFAGKRNKTELYYEAQARRIPLSPVSTAADVAENRQLISRGFFAEFPHPPSKRSVKMPGAPYRFSATPWMALRPAPGLGEHNNEILGALK